MGLMAALFIGVVACNSEITDPRCASPDTCEVSGVDLVPVAAVVDTASIVEHHECCMGDLVNSSRIDVRVTISNRGTVASNTVDAVVSAFGAVTTFTVHTIPQGGSVTQVVSLTFDRRFLVAGTDLQTENVKLRVLNDDAHPENNTLAGHRIMIDVPFLVLEPEITAPQTLRVGENITFSYTYAFGLWSGGASRYSAVSLLFCLELASRSCTSDNWQAVTRRDLNTNSGMPRFTAQLTAQAVPASPPGEYRILICAVPRSRNDLYLQLESKDDYCRPGGTVTVTS
jgi:hypothetical protein